MKPEYEKIIDKPERSFTAYTVKRSSRSKLSQAWHYHPEIEICFTTQSKGKRFVGNQIADYEELDLVMFGTNLPHGFVTNEYCSQIVIQMNIDFLGEDFILKPELRKIRNLFTFSKQGIEFGKKTLEASQKTIHKIINTDGLPQLISLLSLLDILANSEDAKAICGKEYAHDVNVSEFGRLKLVYDHIMSNYRNEVCIKDVADKLNLSEAGFYKFIKKHGKKSYTQIINEFRINNACKLLLDTENTISEISYKCGFNNQSYFNRKFKEIMGSTPYNFRIKFSNRMESKMNQVDNIPLQEN